jgi:DNA polymerase (family 10)
MTRARAENPSIDPSMALKHSRIPLGRADTLASMAIREAHQAGLPADDIVPAGGLRRYAPALDGAVLVALTADARRDELLAGFSRLPIVRSILGRSSSSIRASTDRGLLDLHVTPPEMAGAALVWHTGTRRHARWLQARAAGVGLTFSNGRLERNGASVPFVPDEPSFYRLLDLPYIPPEIREGDDEIAAAERGVLPSLVTTLHIRGDLHMHSTWSDGRDSIMHMVLSSRQIGYEYVAITDHSERSWASRKLLALEIPLQRDEIERVRSQSPGIEILHGVEVDIMPDGSLDFDDEVLAGFDIVLASLHDAHGDNGRRLTERYVQAMRHPLVNIITHPANRSPGLSNGYELDFDRLFREAVATGTAMEVDGAPGHLDMDGRVARRAAEAGVTIAINSDCHRAEALGRQMSFGVGTARRGWIGPEQVLNSRRVDAVREFVARKRGSSP